MKRQQPRAPRPPRQAIERTPRVVHTEYDEEDLRLAIETEKERLDAARDAQAREEAAQAEFDAECQVRTDEREYQRSIDPFETGADAREREVARDSEAEQRAIDWRGRGFPYLPNDHRAAENSGGNPRYRQEELVNREYHGFYKNPS